MALVTDASVFRCVCGSGLARMRGLLIVGGMFSRLVRFFLLFGFWLLGAFFGAGVVDLLWARRDGDRVSALTMNLGLLLFGTVVFFAFALRKPKPGK